MGLGKMQTADFCQEGLLVRDGGESGEIPVVAADGGSLWYPLC